MGEESEGKGGREGMREGGRERGRACTHTYTPAIRGVADQGDGGTTADVVPRPQSLQLTLLATMKKRGHKRRYKKQKERMKKIEMRMRVWMIKMTHEVLAPSLPPSLPPSPISPPPQCMETFQPIPFTYPPRLPSLPPSLPPSPPTSTWQHHSPCSQRQPGRPCE